MSNGRAAAITNIQQPQHNIHSEGWEEEEEKEKELQDSSSLHVFKDEQRERVVKLDRSFKSL